MKNIVELLVIEWDGIDWDSEIKKRYFFVDDAELSALDKAKKHINDNPLTPSGYNVSHPNCPECQGYPRYKINKHIAL